MDAYALWRELQNLSEFTVTGDHLTLLRHAYVRWEDIEFGAPAIDGKRPYGNSSVLHDIAALIDPEFGKDDLVDWDTWIDRNEERLTRLHVETGLALQIALVTGEFRPGVYRKGNRYDRRWRAEGGRDCTPEVNRCG